MTELADQTRASLQTAPEGESEVVLSVRNVSKKFCKKLRRSMAYGIADLAQNLIGLKPDSTTLRKDEFWAVENMDFQLRRGEVLGLIGVNGSGKTTLLRLLSGIFPPDQGEIMLRGRVGALIALGAGFHPHFTGRENVYLNGAILGLSRDELDAHFAKIVDFSEIGDFIDAPVATYSSGMRVRLGFSVAMTMNPDLLLIDEVLAVGDLSFKIKCLNAINDMLHNAAVIFVSHSMQLVSRIATQIMVLHEGRIDHHGQDIGRGIDHYTSRFSSSEKRVSGSGKVIVSKVRLGRDHKSAKEDETQCFTYGDDLFIEITMSMHSSVKQPAIKVFIINQEMYPVAECFSEHCGCTLEAKSGESIITVRVRNMQFNAGIYSIGIIVLDRAVHDEILLRSDSAAAFQMAYSTRSWSSIILSGEWEQKKR
jgi:lipopolysaccharide transport system ATP-binding protein